MNNPPKDAFQSLAIAAQDLFSPDPEPLLCTTLADCSS